jgi:hypothetical protein
MRTGPEGEKIGDYLSAREELIRTYKEQGRRSEIQTALKELYDKKYTG